DEGKRSKERRERSERAPRRRTTQPRAEDAPSATEQRDRVSTPPLRSEIAPQAWRLRKPAPSSSDNIAAPWVAEMPRSVQNATRCACGIDIVTQHRKAAAASSANTRFGGQPNTLGVTVAPPPPRPPSAVSGGGRRKMSASGTMVATANSR